MNEVKFIIETSYGKFEKVMNLTPREVRLWYHHFKKMYPDSIITIE